MSRASRYIANDNDPIYYDRIGEPVSTVWDTHHATPPLSPPPLHHSDRLPTPVKVTRQTKVANQTSVKSEKRDESVVIAAIIWLSAIVTLIWTAINDSNGIQQILASIGVIWMGLWVGYLGHDRRRPRLSDLGTFTALLGVVSVLMTVSLKMNAPLSVADSTAIITAIALLCSVLAKSRIALLLSVCFGLLAAYQYFEGAKISYALFGFPVIWTAQLYQASKLRSKLATLASSIVGYYWLLGFAIMFINAGALRPVNAAVLLFLIGALQYRSGKAATDERGPHDLIHVVMGWGVAVLGAIAVQAYFLWPDMEIWHTKTNINAYTSGPHLWMIGAALLITGIFFANLVRWKNTKLSFFGVLFITLICTLFVGSILFEDSLKQFIASQAELNGVPIIGFTFAAAVTASAIGLCINGARRGIISLILAGLAVLGLQVFILLRPEFFASGQAVENGIIFGGLLIVAICMTALLSHKSLTAIGDT